MLTGPKWDAALYIDERASKEQTDSLTTIYSGQAGGFFAAASNLIGKMLGVKSVPIEFGFDGRRRWLRIKVLLQLQIEGIAGAALIKNHLKLILHSLLCLVLTL
jgi:hypothetical protein